MCDCCELLYPAIFVTFFFFLSGSFLLFISVDRFAATSFPRIYSKKKIRSQNIFNSIIAYATLI